MWNIYTHSTLVDLNLLVTEVWHWLEGVDRDENWTNVGLGEGGMVKETNCTCSAVNVILESNWCYSQTLE